MGRHSVSFLFAFILSSILFAFPSHSSELSEYTKKYAPSSGYAGSELNPFRLAGIDYYPSYVRNAVPLEDEFSFEKLVKVIADKKIQRIEDVIPELPEHMREENYILMYRSRSLQAATPTAPRAIVFTPTASFMLSFNGGAAQAGGQTVEAIQYRRDERRFEFREINFKPGEPPLISAANPAKCIECHQSSSRRDIDMRPNWEPYSSWIGAYGSDGGDIGSNPLKGSSILTGRIRPQDQESLEEQSHELDLFKNYIDNVAPHHPRYSKLGKFSLSSTKDLSNHLAFWNANRVMRLIEQEREIFETYQDTLALVFRCSYAGEEFANNDTMRWHLSFDYPQYFERDEKGLRSLDSISSYLTYVYEPLGVDTSDWSMDFGTGGRFAFVERFGTPSNPAAIFRSVWENTVPSAKFYEQKNCSELQNLSARQLKTSFEAGFQKTIREQKLSVQVQPSAVEILGRCVRCHTPYADDRAPAIPFDEPWNLGKALSRPTKRKNILFDEIQYRTSEMAASEEQMPPLHRLSAKERETLMTYLKELPRENP